MQREKQNNYYGSNSIELDQQIPSYYVIALDDYRRAMIIPKTMMDEFEVEENDEMNCIDGIFKDL